MVEYKEEASLKIWNVSGKMVYERKVSVTEGDKQISIESLDNLPEGTYLLRVFNGAIASEGIKLIKN